MKPIKKLFNIQNSFTDLTKLFAKSKAVVIPAQFTPLLPKHQLIKKAMLRVIQLLNNTSSTNKLKKTKFPLFKT